MKAYLRFLWRCARISFVGDWRYHGWMLALTVIALFGPADPRRTGPYGERHRVVRVSPECAPCNRRECNQPRHACMEDISPDLVLEAARATLGQASTV